MAGKVTVKQAAERIGKSEQFIRIGLQRGLLPFGYAVPGAGKRWNYFINEADLISYMDGNQSIRPHNVKITVEHAAWLMGKSVQFVQMGLQQKVLPFGTAVQMDAYTWDYYISPKLFTEYTGIELNKG